MPTSVVAAAAVSSAMESTSPPSRKVAMAATNVDVAMEGMNIRAPVAMVVMPANTAEHGGAKKQPSADIAPNFR